MKESYSPNTTLPSEVTEALILLKGCWTSLVRIFLIFTV